MIWESGPWKEELARLAKSLMRRKNQKRWQEKSAVKLEQEVLYSAFAIRKLIESFKISDEIRALTIEALEHFPTGRVADIMNWHHIDILYDLSSYKTRNISLLNFCNQIIHSFIFMACFQEESDKLIGIFVSSDRQKSKSLFYFNIDLIIELLLAVANDDVVHMHLVRDGIDKPLRLIRCSSRPDNL